MEEKSLVKVEKNTMFSKIKSFFINLFKKNNKINVNKEEKYIFENKEIEENNISDSLQNFVQNEITEEMKEKVEEENTEALISQVGNNKDELMKLDIQTLKKIDEYYINKLENINSKIENLKAKLGTN